MWLPSVPPRRSVSARSPSDRCGANPRLRPGFCGRYSQHIFFARDGARNFVKEEEFDPAEHEDAFQSEGLHRGLATESLVEALLNAGPEVANVMDVPCSETERRMLASILLHEQEELTAERLDGALRALRRIHLRRRLEETQCELKKPGLGDDKVRMKELLLELERLSRALRDPGLAEDGLRIAPGNKKSA